jgi:hypothetical protein
VRGNLSLESRKFPTNNRLLPEETYSEKYNLIERIRTPDRGEKAPGGDLLLGRRSGSGTRADVYFSECHSWGVNHLEQAFVTAHYIDAESQKVAKMESTGRDRVFGSNSRETSSGESLRFLSPKDIKMIDEMLADVAPFGEVRLTVQKGRLRFVASTKSFDAFKWSSKTVVEDLFEQG